MKFTTGGPKGLPVVFWNDFERSAEYKTNKTTTSKSNHQQVINQTNQLTRKKGKAMKNMIH